MSLRIFITPCPVACLAAASHTLLLPCLSCRIDGLKEHAEKMVTDAQFKAAQHRCMVLGLRHCEQDAFVGRVVS